MKPTIAIAGVDKKTNLSALQVILEQYPHLEVGVLYTYDPENRKRYPTRTEIATIVDKLQGRCALHVCGKRAVQQLLMGDLGDIIKGDMRIQVNGVLTQEEVEDICDLHADRSVITQFNTNNLQHLDVRSANHQLLVDSSGGNGIYPNAWPAIKRQVTKKFVGFAGGLNSNNIPDSMKVFDMLRGPGEYWIDIETAARDKYDYFSLHLVEYFCKIHKLSQARTST